MAAASLLLPLQATAAGVGLGPIVRSADGGQIFGFDVNQHGSDGLFAASRTIGPNGEQRISVETFDQGTGTITHVFAAVKTKNMFSMDGIFANDVGLLTHFVFPHKGIIPKEEYELSSPAGVGRFTGRWTPPDPNIYVMQDAVNQDTMTSVLFGSEVKTDTPEIIVSNVGSNTFGKVIPLDPNVFGGGNSPYVAQDTLTNQAVFVTSLSAGRVGGPPPIIATVDLTTGRIATFQGVGPGTIFGPGSPRGLAVDSATGIACTTTELDAGVEFYDLAKRAGFEITLPGATNTSQANSGSAIAADPLHKLFLVTQPISSNTQHGSSVDVFDEHGNLVEAINGFNASSPSLPPTMFIVIDPAKRMGWVSTARVNELQSFTY